MRMSRPILAFVLLTTTMAPSFAADGGKGKPAARAKHKRAAEPAVIPPPAPPMSDDESAVASCKKHVESMLKESAETTFSSGPEFRVSRGTDGNFDVTGWVTSKKTTGIVERDDFACHASRFGGSLWT